MKPVQNICVINARDSLTNRQRCLAIARRVVDTSEKENDEYFLAFSFYSVSKIRNSRRKEEVEDAWPRRKHFSRQMFRDGEQSPPLVLLDVHP